MIFISNNPHIFSEIEPRIKSSLSVEEIEFKPYTVAEMMDILKERAANGFRAVESGVVALASAHAINKGGDVRVGLECLMKAGRIAESESSDKVAVEHVRKVLKDVVKAKPEILKERVSDVERMVLDMLSKKSRATLDELYKEYSESVNEPLTRRMFMEYVNHLGGINLVKVGKRKLGKSRIISKV